MRKSAIAEGGNLRTPLHNRSVVPVGAIAGSGDDMTAMKRLPSNERPGA